MKAEERNMSEEMCLTDDDQLNPEQTVARETENAEEYSEEKEKRTSGPLTRFGWISVCGTVVSWIIMLLTIWNITSAFGEAVSVVTIFEFLFSIFSIRSGTIYVTLAKCFLSVLYVVLFVISVKKLVWITGNVYKTVSHKVMRNTPKRPETTANFICEYTASILIRFYAFLIVAYILSGDPLTAGSWIGIAVGAVYAIILVCLAALPRKESGKTFSDKGVWRQYLFLVGRQVLLLLCVGCMAFALGKPAGYDLAFGLQVLFGGYFHGVSGFFNTIYYSLAENVIYLIAFAFLFSLIQLSLTGVSVSSGVRRGANHDLKKLWLRILILIAVYALLTGLFSAIGSDGGFHVTDEIISSWWSAVKDGIVPAILIAAAGVLSVSGLLQDEGSEMKRKEMEE